MVISRSEEPAKQQQWQSCSWTSPLTFLTLTSRLLSTCLTMCRTKHRSSRWLPSSVFCGQLCWDWRWLVSSAHDQQRVDQTGLLLLGCVWVRFAHISSCHGSVSDSYCQRDLSIFFSRPTSSSTIARSPAHRRCLGSCGRNTPCLIRGIWPRMPLSFAWRQSRLSLGDFSLSILLIASLWNIRSAMPCNWSCLSARSMATFSTMRRVCWMCRIVGRRGIIFGFITFSLTWFGWLLGAVSHPFSSWYMALKGCWYGLDYIQQSVVEISKAFKILAEGDVVQKRK